MFLSSTTDKKRSILLIAYAFPPIPYGGTYRALRLCRGFAEHGIACHVVTLKEYADIPNDYDLLARVPESVRIHRAPILDPWRRYQRFKNKHGRRFWFPLVNKIVSLLLRPITFPDHMLFWVPFAAIRARQVAKREGGSTVLVSSPPDSSQLIGWFLKKALKIKWIADFRDPIYGNIAHVSMIDPRGSLNRLQKKLLYRYDRFIARRADTLIANTRSHADWLQSEYGLREVHVIRNSFDPDDFSDTVTDRFRELTIAHVGSIYGRRNPELLFAAVKRLADEYAPEPLSLKLIFLGSGSDGLKRAVEKHGIGAYVRLIDQVPHGEALRMMRGSHLLLLIKATGKWSRGQIPGKFFEYIGSRNPVLCLGPKDSEVADIIHEHKLGYVVEDDLEELLEILRVQYKQYRSGEALPTLRDAQVVGFSSTMMVHKMLSAAGFE